MYIVYRIIKKPVYHGSVISYYVENYIYASPTDKLMHAITKDRSKAHLFSNRIEALEYIWANKLRNYKTRTL